MSVDNDGDKEPELIDQIYSSVKELLTKRGKETERDIALERLHHYLSEAISFLLQIVCILSLVLIIGFLFLLPLWLSFHVH